MKRLLLCGLLCAPLAAPIGASLLTGCGASSSEPAASDDTATDTTSGDSVEAEGSTGAERPSMTSDECTAAGGTLVGDIGDGAIHRPDYLCESGQPPIATVPLGIEGSVCCQ